MIYWILTNLVVCRNQGHPHFHVLVVTTLRARAPAGCGRMIGMTASEGPTVGTLVLLRHGESDWNAKNLFTGWSTST